jgi:cytochrome c-type biogenesis protein CcmH
VNKLLFALGCLLLLLLAVLFMWWPLRRRLRLLSMLGVLVVPVLACLLYWHWGSSAALFSDWQQQENHRQAEQYLKQQKDPQVIVDRLKALLDSQPNQPRGWFLLGNVYVEQNKLPAAYEAYHKAHEYDPKNLDYILALCQADMAINRVMRAANRDALLQAAKRTPENVSVGYVLGFDAYSRGEYAQARKHWESVLQKLPADSADAKQVLLWIAKAQKQLR